ncbi:hypothetical protein FHS43_005871 [Streptosporangium becharense]|uniref:Uncharacterized protein n=1 Tax=Streptosporangium becharense TaxID=1816182 RepID=A0A7W9INQ8_9ACTN|nr:hypothetical protein [Streptosporangium becharense]MBB2914559.1 hypothetical protein [Streptosporangium becharense]MBB5823404.1 hypothetical protein [Streptosporangium becharense]
MSRPVSRRSGAEAGTVPVPDRPENGDHPDDHTPTPAATRNPAISAGPRSCSRETRVHGRCHRLGGGGMENGLLEMSVQPRRSSGARPDATSRIGRTGRTASMGCVDSRGSAGLVEDAGRGGCAERAGRAGRAASGTRGAAGYGRSL